MKTYEEAAREVMLTALDDKSKDKFDRFLPTLQEVINAPVTMRMIRRALETQDCPVEAHLAAMLTIGIRIGMTMEEWDLGTLVKQ